MTETVVEGTPRVVNNPGLSIEQAFRTHLVSEEDGSRMRKQALSQMRQLVSDNEPGSLSLFDVKDSRSRIMSNVLRNVQSKPLKAHLIRVAVDEQVAEGNRRGVVDLLVDARSFELPLYSYDENFVVNLFDQALAVGDSRGAENIADTVIRSGRRIFRQSEGQPLFKPSEQWVSRKERAFLQYAEKVVEEVDRAEDWADTWRLQLIFNDFRTRSDGFYSDNPSELSKRVGEKMVQQCIKFAADYPSTALRYAIDADMPKDVIIDLREKVDKSPAHIKAFKRMARNVLKVAGLFSPTA